MKWKPILLIPVCGVVVALLSVVYSQDMTVGVGASITGYGLPMLWLKKVSIVVPGNPTTYSLYGSGSILLVDIVFWIIIVAIIYAAYGLIKKRYRAKE
jgi:ribose/xylose/arabinose/galactoside ABC-type transport system permease subunit